MKEIINGRIIDPKNDKWIKLVAILAVVIGIVCFTALALSGYIL
jgi:uncharacterized membrane protein HdeD (DUF308 family)